MELRYLQSDSEPKLKLMVLLSLRTEVELLELSFISPERCYFFPSEQLKFLQSFV